MPIKPTYTKFYHYRVGAVDAFFDDEWRLVALWKGGDDVMPLLKLLKVKTSPMPEFFYKEATEMINKHYGMDMLEVKE